MTDARETKRLAKDVAKSIRQEPERWRRRDGDLVRDDGLRFELQCFSMVASAWIRHGEESVYISDAGHLLSARVWWNDRETGIAAGKIRSALAAVSPQVTGAQDETR